MLSLYINMYICIYLRIHTVDSTDIQQECSVGVSSSPRDFHIRASDTVLQYILHTA